MLLLAGMPMLGSLTASAEPAPQQQSQAATTIEGTVMDENNEPVIGASIVQKGVANNAVATDAFGNFKIRIPVGAQLEVSYVGYKTTVVRAAQGMTVYLEPTSEMLNEVVAIGYGSQKKANLTGAVATVDVARTMDSRPVQDVTRALQGAVPGLTITAANGDFSSEATMRIRGVGTLSNGQTSNPLIVVDGVPVDDLSFVNPEDVAEISVLKDAASSAVYGTRAAFGVILVTTKEGTSKDRVSLKYTNNFAWNNATVLPSFARTTEDLTAGLNSSVRDGSSNEIFGMYYTDILPFAQKWEAQNAPYDSYRELHPYVDENNVGDYYIMPNGQWLRYAEWDVAKTLFRSAPAQKHNVSLEGTSGKTSYRLSFGYDSKEGLLRFNPEKMQRYMANASITTQIFSWLKAGARINFSDREYQSPSLFRNSYQYMWRWPSFFETYGWVADAEGNPMDFSNAAIGYRRQAHVDKTVTQQTRLQGWMQAEIIKGLTLQADFTYAVRNQNSEAANTPFTMWNTWTAKAFTTTNPYSQANTMAAQSNYKDDMWTTNIFATYAKSFNNAYNLKVMAGFTAEQEEYNYFYASRKGLTDYSKPNINLTNGTTYNTNGSNWKRATAGVFGRINFDYKGIYLLEFNGRYDGSSRFPANDQWAFFPSGSIGYRFSEEPYFKALKNVWSNGKIRASYGHIGNESVGQYRFLSTVAQVAASNVNWLTGSQKITEYGMPTLVSSSLTWERVVTTDVGVDLGFFNNSLNLGFDWYQRETRDMLAPAQELPSVLGVSAPYGNNGTLRTRGWELNVGWNHSFGDWDIYINGNLSDARTKVVKWNNPSELIYTYNPGNSNYYEGQYFGDIWGLETDRYFTEDDFNADGSYKQGIADQTGLESGNFVYGPGDVKFVDQNGDGVINNGIEGMISLNGQYYVPGDPGYDEALKNKDHKAVAVGSVNNHGDLKVIGNALPRYEYSFRVGGAWKGFDLDLFFQGVGKRNMWATGSTIIPYSQANIGLFDNQLSYNSLVLDSDYKWTGEYNIDQNNMYPLMYAGSSGTGTISNIGRGCYNFYPQSRYLINMAYLRLKNITFGYTLPAEITTKALIQKARIYFSADNLCFLYNGASKYALDPEINRSSGSEKAGQDGGNATYGRTVPMMRTFSFGIQVTF